MIAGIGFFRDKIRSGEEKIGEGFLNGVFFDNGGERKASRGWSRKKKTESWGKEIGGAKRAAVRERK